MAPRPAHSIDKVCALHSLHGLAVDVTKDETHAALAAVLIQALERIHAGRIERGHAAHADSQILRKVLERNIGDTVGHAKEHRPVNLVHTHALE